MDVVNDTKPFNEWKTNGGIYTNETSKQSEIMYKNLTEYKWNESTKANENNEITNKEITL